MHRALTEGHSSALLCVASRIITSILCYRIAVASLDVALALPKTTPHCDPPPLSTIVLLRSLRPGGGVDANVSMQTRLRARGRALEADIDDPSLCVSSSATTSSFTSRARSSASLVSFTSPCISGPSLRHPRRCNHRQHTMQRLSSRSGRRRVARCKTEEGWGEGESGTVTVVGRGDTGRAC